MPKRQSDKNDRQGVRSHVNTNPTKSVKAPKVKKPGKSHPNIWRLLTFVTIIAGVWAIFNGLVRITPLNMTFFGLELGAMLLLILLLIVSLLEQTVPSWFRWALAITGVVITAPHVIILLPQLY